MIRNVCSIYGRRARSEFDAPRELHSAVRTTRVYFCYCRIEFTVGERNGGGVHRRERNFNNIISVLECAEHCRCIRSQRECDIKLFWGMNNFANFFALLCREKKLLFSVHIGRLLLR